MDSRMNKYHELDNDMSRVSKHSDLYKDINNADIDNYTLKSNATVLGHQENEIDIEKIKKILDTRYKDTAKRKSIRLEKEEDDTSLVPSSTTKEYDLNKILEKAHTEKEETYEEARAKKLRDTQFDILNNLNLKNEESDNLKEENPKDQSKDQDDDLMNLIHTITINEVKKQVPSKSPAKESDDPLDLLSDLKGHDNTEVFEGIKEEIEKIEKTSKILETKKQEEKLENSFYTTSSVFKKSDLVEDDNFLDEEKMSIWIKILIALLIIAFLAGLFLFLKSFFKF